MTHTARTTQNQKHTVILAALRNLQADVSSGRDLRFLDDLLSEDCGELITNDSAFAAAIDDLCESVNLDGLTFNDQESRRYWALYTRLAAPYKHRFMPDLFPKEAISRLTASELIELKQLHNTLFGEGQRSADPRHESIHRPGQRVRPRGCSNFGYAGVIQYETGDDARPALPGEPVWFIRFDNGAEGGGWRDTELEAV